MRWPSLVCRTARSRAWIRSYTQSAWDELLADTNSSTHGSSLNQDTPTNSVLRDILYAQERPNSPSLRQRRRHYDTSALTPSESAQFRRIFELLGQETDHTPVPDPALDAFAQRNALRPKKLTARGGGVGTRFEAGMEGLAAQIPVEELDRGVDHIWEALQTKNTVVETWQWAEKHVWAQDAAYGAHTAFFAPALHMLLLTLRDKYRAPHTALAVMDRTRKNGAHAYVLGCTSSLFAEMIRTQWLCLGDAQGVLATAREARSAGVFTDSSAKKTERDDASLHTQMERVRDQLRAHVMNGAQARVRNPDGTLAMLADDHDALQMAAELGRIMGRKSLRPKPATKPKVPRKSKTPKSLLIYPQDPQSLLRTEVHRRIERPVDHDD